MKRYASHYILLSPDKVLRQHFIEVDNSGKITCISPLTEEIAGTIFYNGIIFPSNMENINAAILNTTTDHAEISLPQKLFKLGIVASREDFPVYIYHLDSINLSSPELSTNDRGRYCHIQRL